jgi:YHS domain-containing protein
MRVLAMVFLLAAGCAGAPPSGVNLRDGRGYCPICTDWHDVAAMKWPLEFRGRTYAFCDANCRAAFLKDPEKYLKDPEFDPTPSRRSP